MTYINDYTVSKDGRCGFEKILLCTDEQISIKQLSALPDYKSCLENMTQELDKWLSKMCKSNALAQLAMDDRLVFSIAITREQDTFQLQEDGYCTDESWISKNMFDGNIPLHMLHYIADGWILHHEEQLSKFFADCMITGSVQLTIAVQNRINTAVWCMSKQQCECHLEANILYGQEYIVPYALQHLRGISQCVESMLSATEQWLGHGDDTIFSVMNTLGINDKLVFEVQLTNIPTVFTAKQMCDWKERDVNYCTNKDVTTEMLDNMKNVAIFQDQLRACLQRWLIDYRNDVLKCFGARSENQPLRIAVAIQSLRRTKTDVQKV